MPMAASADHTTKNVNVCSNGGDRRQQTYQRFTHAGTPYTSEGNAEAQVETDSRLAHHPARHPRSHLLTHFDDGPPASFYKIMSAVPWQKRGETYFEGAHHQLRSLFRRAMEEGRLEASPS